MPYVKHEDGFEAAHLNHNATNSTLGGFDQLIRCRGHYPDPASCDDLLYAHVPDADVCENCTVISEEEYDDFHSARTVHIYEHQFLPAKRETIRRLKLESTAHDENVIQLTRDMARQDKEAVLFASSALPELHARRLQLSAEIAGMQKLIEADEAELAQARLDYAAEGSSVRKRRLREYRVAE